MKDVIFLTCNRNGVVKMTKSMPALARGEIPVKVEVIVEPGAFREPVLATSITIADWREGVDIADVELKERVITQEEADMIRARRLTAMREVLEARGYVILLPGEGQGNEDQEGA